MSWFDIAKTCLNVIDTGAGDGEYNYLSTSLGVNVPVYYSNALDDRTEDIVPRIEVYDLYADTDPLTKCLASQYNSILQVSIFVEASKASGQLLKLIDEMNVIYQTATALPQINDMRVHVAQNSPTRPRPDGKFWRVDLSVDYFAYVERV